MTVADRPARTPAPRSGLRAVAVPAEHGGWGLTLEPGLLGLLVAPSAAGACVALAAVVAFLARTPLKAAVVDRRRGRVLARTRLAQRVAAAELAVLALLAAGALALGEPRFWVPAAAALPLFAIEGWYDVRSRSRRLVPELAGAVGVCSVVAMVVLADGGSAWLAAGLWAVLAARVVTSIPHVRAQIARLHQRAAQAGATTAGDASAVVLAAGAVVLHRSLAAGAVAVIAVIVVQRVARTRPVPRPVVIGMRQMVLGLAVVLVTALGVILLGN